MTCLKLHHLSLLLAIIISEHLYIYHYEISNAIHALCQYVANRKHLRQRLKESKVSVSSLGNAGRLFLADEPAQENALLPAQQSSACIARYDELSVS